MARQIRDLALLRNRIETALRAAAGPMGCSELLNWPSITEVAGGDTKGKERTSYQAAQMVKQGLVEKVGSGFGVSYAWKGPEAPAAPTPSTPLETLPELRVRVNKSQHSISLVFEGLAITIEVAP